MALVQRRVANRLALHALVLAITAAVFSQCSTEAYVISEIWTGDQPVEGADQMDRFGTDQMEDLEGNFKLIFFVIFQKFLICLFSYPATRADGEAYTKFA